MGAPAESTTPDRTGDKAPESTVVPPRPDNPVAVEFTKLAKRPTRQQQMDEIVENLNATAFSHRQVEWKFARLRF